MLMARMQMLMKVCSLYLAACTSSEARGGEIDVAFEPSVSFCLETGCSFLEMTHPFVEDMDGCLSRLIGTCSMDQHVCSCDHDIAADETEQPNQWVWGDDPMHSMRDWGSVFPNFHTRPCTRRLQSRGILKKSSQDIMHAVWGDEMLYSPTTQGHCFYYCMVSAVWQLESCQIKHKHNAHMRRLTCKALRSAPQLLQLAAKQERMTERQYLRATATVQWGRAPEAAVLSHLFGCRVVAVNQRMQELYAYGVGRRVKLGLAREHYVLLRSDSDQSDRTEQNQCADWQTCECMQRGGAGREDRHVHNDPQRLSLTDAGHASGRSLYPHLLFQEGDQGRVQRTLMPPPAVPPRFDIPYGFLGSYKAGGWIWMKYQVRPEPPTDTPCRNHAILMMRPGMATLALHVTAEESDEGHLG